MSGIASVPLPQEQVWRARSLSLGVTGPALPGEGGLLWVAQASTLSLHSENPGQAGLWASHQAAIKAGKTAANSLKVNPQPTLHHQVKVRMQVQNGKSKQVPGLEGLRV